MSTDDLKQHVDSSHDFYALLNITQSAQESEIRRAYRKTALKYHPDKVGPSDTEALEKFHLLQIAYEVLSDPTIRELYDNAQRAKQQARERETALSERRSDMKRDLERREQEAGKRKRGEFERDQGEMEWQRELERIREDTKRRRTELEERRRREMEVLDAEEREEASNTVPAERSKAQGVVEEVDRSIKLRFLSDSRTKEGTEFDKDHLTGLFSRFGPIEDIILRIKPPRDSKKHKKQYSTAMLVFQSVVGAHAVITDFSRASAEQPDAFGMFKDVDWAAGQPPDFIPQAKSSTSYDAASRNAVYGNEQRSKRFETSTTNISDARGDSRETNANGAPKFANFKAKQSTGANGGGSPSLDEMTMIRLKNAEKRRLEKKIREEEAAADVADAQAS